MGSLREPLGIQLLPWGGVTPESVREGFLGKRASGSGWAARGASGRARVQGGTARSPVSEAADAKVMRRGRAGSCRGRGLGRHS